MMSQGFLSKPELPVDIVQNKMLPKDIKGSAYEASCDLSVIMWLSLPVFDIVAWDETEASVLKGNVFSIHLCLKCTGCGALLITMGILYNIPIVCCTISTQQREIESVLKLSWYWLTQTVKRRISFCTCLVCVPVRLWAIEYIWTRMAIGLTHTCLLSLVEEFGEAGSG